MQYLHYWICNNEHFQTFLTVRNQYIPDTEYTAGQGFGIFSVFGYKLGMFKWESFDLIQVCIAELLLTFGYWQKHIN